MEEDLVCDHCDKIITDYKDDLFHFSGNINGELNMHIHLCKKCTSYYASAHPIFINFDSVEGDLRSRGYWGDEGIPNENRS